MHRYELGLSREAAGRLLALAEEGRPAFLSFSQVQGVEKRKLFVWQVSLVPLSTERGAWVEIPSLQEFLTGFDIIKVFSDQGIWVITPGRIRLEHDYISRFRRLLDTYGRDDPFPELTIGIVGLGRLGSKVAQALSEQGARRLLLIDPQTLEEANRQLAIYSRFPLGTPKLAAIKEFLSPYKQELTTIQKPLWELNAEEWRAFADLDVLFLCVDNALTRLVACQWAMRAGIPVIEGGVHIEIRAGRPPRLLGRVQTAIPGRWCLFCLPEGADLGTAALELEELEWLGRRHAIPQPADPTLSEWLAAAMVLLFRQALHRGGIAPRYTFQLASEDGILARREAPPIPPQCQHCRPLAAQTEGVWSGGGQPARERTDSLAAQRLRGADRLRRPFTRLLERAATWAGATAGGVLGTALALGMALGLLAAIRHMIGFWDHCGWRGCSGTPNLLHFLWYFWNDRYYDHHAGHFFGLLWSMVLLLSLPYMLVGLPLFGARWGYAASGRPFTQRRARRALRGAFQGLEMLRDRWPLAPQLRVHPIPQRILQRWSQGLAVITEVAAVILLIPIFRAFPWWFFAGCYVLVFYLAWGIVWGGRHNHRAIARFIEQLCQRPIMAFLTRWHRG
jgi:hypothetical protein